MVCLTKSSLIVLTWRLFSRRSDAFLTQTSISTNFVSRKTSLKTPPISQKLVVPTRVAAKPLLMATSSNVDYGDVAKYFVATGVQFGILSGALKGIDLTLTATKRTLPFPLVALLFCFLSLRSRVASILDNSRPNRDAQEGKATPADIQRPSWTPPGIAFPFIWLTITALRGISSGLVYSQTAALCSTPLLAMVLHLSIGDTWNTITNVEKRLGVSAVGVLAVWVSVWNAIWRYYKVLPLAGKILAPSGVWISIATVLTWSIWRINKPRQPLWPVQGDGKSSSYKWSNLGQLQATSIGGSTEQDERSNGKEDDE